MPMFELDAGRPAPLQPMQPAAGTFDTDSTSVVGEHLGSLLGEPLFPVARRTPGSSDAPHLLAVDAAGQPVVVEVVQVLDAAALTRSLRFAGAAARMSSVDLARAYGPGPDEFAADLVAFRETVPVSTAHAAARHGGARLLLVCSEVAESVVDAVEFLRGPGRRIDVLQVGVVRGSDGRRFVEVSPLVANVPSRRPVEPSPVRVVTSGDHGAGAPHPRPREQLAGATAPVGTFPSVLPVPVGGGATEPRTVPDGVRPAPDDTPTGPITVVRAPQPLPVEDEPTAEDQTVPSDETVPGGPTVPDDVTAPEGVDVPDGAPLPDAVAEDVAVPDDDMGVTGAADIEVAEDVDVDLADDVLSIDDIPPGEMGVVSAADVAVAGAHPATVEDLSPTPVEGDGSAEAAQSDAVTVAAVEGGLVSSDGAPAVAASHEEAAVAPEDAGAATGSVPDDSADSSRTRDARPEIAVAVDTDTGESDPPAEPQPPPSGQDAIPALVALAERLGGTTTLVWTRLRRGQRFVAMLRRDGLLQLPDGTVHADPDAAATAVADAESSVDGWRAWHVGDGGPSLAEAREG